MESVFSETASDGSGAVSFNIEMDPVGFEIKDQKYNRTQSPGERICPEDHLDGRNQFYGNGDVGHADDTPADHHHKHGNDGFSGSSEKTCQTM